MCRAICEDRAEWNGLDVDRYQSIVLPADDPREKDRIPPAGCPWRRFFARNVDAGLYGLLWSMLSQWVFRINPDNFIQFMAGLAWTVACGYVGWLLTFVFEPVLLHYWGTTPGKWIFGLSVRDEDGSKLSIRTAYARLWGVFGYGNCYALPFFDWYYNYKCYRACKEEELPWDLENGCSIVVREREVRWYRVALYLLVLVLRAAAGYGIDIHAKQPPNRGELTLEQFVENCNDYLKYNENLPPYVTADGTWMRICRPAAGHVHWQLLQMFRLKPTKMVMYSLSPSPPIRRTVRWALPSAERYSMPLLLRMRNGADCMRIPCLILLRTAGIMMHRIRKTSRKLISVD